MAVAEAYYQTVLEMRKTLVMKQFDPTPDIR